MSEKNTDPSATGVASAPEHAPADDAALRAPDPLAASPPLHPSYEDRPGAPDRVMASLGDGAFEHLVDEWERILDAPGVLNDVEVAELWESALGVIVIGEQRPVMPAPLDELKQRALRSAFQVDPGMIRGDVHQWPPDKIRS